MGVCCSHKSISQPLTISDPQASDSVSTCCRSSRHLPGNADVLEEKHELNKAFRFCHHSYVVLPLQASAFVFSRSLAICWAVGMLRPAQRGGSRQSHSVLQPPQAHWALQPLEVVKRAKPNKENIRRFCQLSLCNRYLRQDEGQESVLRWDGGRTVKGILSISHCPGRRQRHRHPPRASSSAYLHFCSAQAQKE